VANPGSISKAGTYYIKATNTLNCYDIKPVNVGIEFVPVLTINDPLPRCASVDITASSVTLGSPVGLKYTYWRDAAAKIPLSNADGITESGTYYIRGATSADCNDIKPVNVVVYSLPLLDITDPPVANYPSTINIEDAFVKDPNLSYTYWMDADATSPLQNYSSISRSDTLYVKAVNANGCSVIKPVKIIINTPSQPEIFVPKAFAPMQSVNNRLYPILFDINKMLRFVVYNRWGVKVFETNDATPENGWDGTNNNTIQFLETYTWYAEGLDTKGKIVRRNGNTLLVR
jgi:hypothetical protein